MTPQEIALEAVYAESPELRTGLSDDMVEADKLAALILSAAAKMVRQSGAVEALELAQNGLQCYRHECPAHDSQADNETDSQIAAALASLRSLTEHQEAPPAPGSPGTAPDRPAA